MKKLVLLTGKSRYNVLPSFTEALAEGLKANECIVEIIDFTDEATAIKQLKQLKENPPNVVIAFNGIVYSQIREYLDVPYIGWLVDPPIHHHRRIIGWGENDYVICIDRRHAMMAKQYYDNTNAGYFIPHGGICHGELKSFANRSVDVMFSGTYSSSDYYINDMQSRLTPAEQQLAFDLIMCMQEYRLTLDEALKKYLDESGVTYSKTAFLNMCLVYCSADDYIRAFYREELIRTLVNNGIKVNVYGENWESFDVEAKDNLIIHEPLDYKKSLEIMADAKIVLNLLPNFQEGGHERIFSALLNEALCITDSNSYLEKEFVNGEHILYYSRDKLEEVPFIVSHYLEHENEAQCIIENAYNVAKEKHTWEARAKELLAEIDFL